MRKLRQAVIVEGRYDKSKLCSMLDATIITTDGFDIFKDPGKMNLIRALAAKDGVIILTDSDAAGFRIRSYIAGVLPKETVTHVYIPDIPGKEHRKAQPSAEGKLGVEGIPAELLMQALERAGVFADGEPAPEAKRRITQADLMEWGLSGGEESFARRQKVLKKLKLPARMNTKAMLQSINALYSYEDFAAFLETL